MRTAISQAQDYFLSIQDLLGGNIQDIRLDEVELTEDRKYWLITLGFLRPINTGNPLLEEMATFRQFEREYKTIKVDTETGEAIAILIRMLW